MSGGRCGAVSHKLHTRVKQAAAMPRHGHALGLPHLLADRVERRVHDKLVQMPLVIALEVGSEAGAQGRGGGDE